MILLFFFPPGGSEALEVSVFVVARKTADSSSRTAVGHWRSRRLLPPLTFAPLSLSLPRLPRPKHTHTQIGFIRQAFAYVVDGASQVAPCPALLPTSRHTLLSLSYANIVITEPHLSAGVINRNHTQKRGKGTSFCLTSRPSC